MDVRFRIFKYYYSNIAAAIYERVYELAQVYCDVPAAQIGSPV